MILYLARHGETDVNKEKRACGRIDAPINSLGVSQAEEMALAVPKDIVAIYCSSLQRTKQTAEIVNKNLNLPIYVADQLTERDFGSLSGKLWDDWDQDLRKLDKAQQYNYQPYGGESVDDVKVRLTVFLNDIQAKYESPVLGITSGGIIRLLHHMLHSESHGHIPNGSIHKFEV